MNLDVKNFTLRKLKKIEPTSISPTSINRSSPRITASKNDDKALDQFDVSVILNQMKYLFDTNMQLITIVKNLHTKYDVIINNNSETIKSNDNLKNEISKIQEEIEIVSDKNKKMQEQISKPTISIDNSDLVNSLQEKIGKLEQSAVNNNLILQGEQISNLIRNAQINNQSIKNEIKNKLSNILPENDKYLVNEISDVKVYGRDLKFIRIQMSNIGNKKELIINLKKLRPDNIYVSEFLVQSKLKLYHQLRIHAKSNRNKILRIFTRNGNIMYIDAVDNEIKLVNSENDIKIYKIHLFLNT